jgi:hypothetical protein
MAARRPGEEWLSSVGGTRFDEVHVVGNVGNADSVFLRTGQLVSRCHVVTTKKTLIHKP